MTLDEVVMQEGRREGRKESIEILDKMESLLNQGQTREFIYDSISLEYDLDEEDFPRLYNMALKLRR